TGVQACAQYGPDIDRPAYDPAVQAASGWMSLNGGMRAPTFLADELAGLHAAIGALAALAHRHRTGEGQHVDVAMLDSVLASSCGLLTLAAAGAPPAPMGNETDFVVPSNVYACLDGSVYLAIALNKHWRSLVALIGDPTLGRHTSNQERLAHRDEINAAIAGWCRERPTSFVIKAFTEAGLVAERIRTLSEVAEDPHVLARDMLQPTELHNGTVAPLTGPAVKFSRTPTRVRRGGSAPGADTESVLT
ncbi:MAG TPA: carnitine dehydratase, partial [Micromonosporaceae bacterium]|nr:carnitine dehydratase [Micromonosporaceae bacterium]